jgi:hypothetical protein
MCRVGSGFRSSTRTRAHARPAATTSERPVVLFQRLNPMPTGETVYLVGSPAAAALWQPTRVLLEAAGALHQVACPPVPI